TICHHKKEACFYLFKCRHPLAVAVQLQGIASLPGCPAGTTHGQVELVALAQAAALLARRRQATHLPVLVHGPGVDQDHLEELVCGVLSYPVGR
ncbi:hypothetical protein J4Q44_G00032770, partial [Coregonus suidteri]